MFFLYAYIKHPIFLRFLKYQFLSTIFYYYFRFPIEAAIFVAISIYNSWAYIHIRRYNGEFPTKDGVAMTGKDWESLIENYLTSPMRTGRVKSGQITFTNIGGGLTITKPNASNHVNTIRLSSQGLQSLNAV